MRTHEELVDRRIKDMYRKVVISGIIKSLMKTDMDRLNNIINDLIQRHVKLTGTDGFYHRGVLFSNIKSVGQVSLQKQPIHPSLRDEMFEYEKQVKEFKADKDLLTQGISVLIRGASTPQEVRNALPDLLLQCMGSPEHLLERTQPELHTLTSKLHRQQYEKTLDKIYFYLGSRLLG